MAKSKEYQMAIKIAGQVEQSFKSSMGLTERELKNIARQAAASANKTKNSIGTGFRDVNKVVDAFSNGAKKALGVVTKAATVTATAVGGIAGASIKVGKEFEAQMSTVQSISRSSEEDMEALNNKAKEIGETTKFSATEAGQAMEYMAMAGWKTDDMLNSVDGIMNLAAASGEELGSVSDIVTDAMTAFGMKADESTNGLANATHFANVLAQASANANTNVGMLGESFKYCAPVAGSMGYSVEDVSVALGAMANSGIKASSAGTSLRTLLTNMAKPTDAMQSAMDMLGVSLDDGKGNMKDLSEVMQELRKGFGKVKVPQEEFAKKLSELDNKFQNGELTEKKYNQELERLTKRCYGAEGALKAQAAAQLAGKTGMAGLLAIVNTSEEDFNKLTDAINNSAGAAEEMAKVKMDNLEGDTTLFKSAAEGLGIEIYEQMNGGLRDVMQMITSWTGKITDYIKKNRFIENIAEGVRKSVPTLVRNFKNVGTSIAEFAKPFLGIAEWMIKNPAVIEGTLSGIVTAIVSLKVASKIYDIATSFGTLAGILTNPFALAILGVGAALGGAAGIAMYVKKCNDEMKKQNLADHFGTISLSLEELQDAAGRILGSKSLSKLNNTLEEFDKVDEIAKGIEDTVKDLDKINWKVSVGMKLTKEEKQTYKDDITSFIKETQELAEQKRYAISLSVNLLTDNDAEGKDIRNTVDSYFAGKQGELAELGTKLQKTVNKAFDDGLLTIDEQEKISKIQEQMANISEGLAESEFNANLELIKGEYAGGNMDAETFKNMQSELQAQADSATEGYKDALRSNIAAADAMLKDGDISKEKYNKMVDEYWENYREKVGELQYKVQNFSLDTITNQYSGEITGAENIFDETLKNYMGRETDWSQSAGLMIDGFVEQFKSANMMDSATRDAVNELLKQMEPTTAQLEELKQKYEEAGKTVPSYITNGLHKAMTLRAYTGDEEAIWQLIGEAIANDEDYAALIQKVREEGGAIPVQIANAIEEKHRVVENAAKTTKDVFDKASVYEFSKETNVDINLKTNQAETNNVLKNTASNMRSKMSEFLKQQFENPFDIVMKVKTIAETIAQAKNTSVGKIAHNAKGSIITKPTLSWFAEDGPEAAIPLDGSRRAKSLWIEAGQLLGMYQRTPEANTMISQAEQMMNTDSASSATSKSLKMLEQSENNSVSNSITYAPKITIQGNARKEDIEAALETEYEKFERMMDRYNRNKKRTSFA